MEFKLDEMTKWERQKALFLLETAEELGYNTESYGELSVNTSSGYVYIWSEWHDFSLFMPINCDLIKTDVFALWTNHINGEEEEFRLEDETTLNDIEEWVEELNKAEEELDEELNKEDDNKNI